MKKKLFAIIICIVMVVGLLPTVAFAAENYDLYVNGEQFTSEKLSITCGGGTASYDPNDKDRSLTVHNSNGGKSGDSTARYQASETPTLTIGLTGNTHFTTAERWRNFCRQLVSDKIASVSVTGNLRFTVDGMHSIRLIRQPSVPRGCKAWYNFCQALRNYFL